MSWPFVIGVGSHHGDDQAGWLVVKHLRERNFPETRIICLQDPAELIDRIEAGQDLVICDACSGNGTPGATRCGIWRPTTLDRQPNSKSEGYQQRLNEVSVADQPRSGSHDLSLFDVMELGYSLNGFPESAEIWTMEGTAWVPGTEPSAAIQSAAVRVANSIWEKYHHA